MKNEGLPLLSGLKTKVGAAMQTAKKMKCFFAT
jgi:hypothetical protein